MVAALKTETMARRGRRRESAPRSLSTNSGAIYIRPTGRAQLRPGGAEGGDQLWLSHARKVVKRADTHGARVDGFADPKIAGVRWSAGLAQVLVSRKRGSAMVRGNEEGRSTTSRAAARLSRSASMVGRRR